MQCRELRREKPINARTDRSNARRGPDQEATLKKIASLHGASRQHWVGDGALRQDRRLNSTENVNVERTHS